MILYSAFKGIKPTVLENSLHYVIEETWHASHQPYLERLKFSYSSKIFHRNLYYIKIKSESVYSILII